MEMRDGLILEYSQLEGIPPAKETVLQGPTENTPTIKNLRLLGVSAGWEPAGSMARYTTGYFAVRYEDNTGAGQGMRTKWLEVAAEKYARLVLFQNSLRK